MEVFLNEVVTMVTAECLPPQMPLSREKLPYSTGMGFYSYTTDAITGIPHVQAIFIQLIYLEMRNNVTNFTI